MTREDTRRKPRPQPKREQPPDWVAVLFLVAVAEVNLALSRAGRCLHRNRDAFALALEKNFECANDHATVERNKNIAMKVLCY